MSRRTARTLAFPYGTLVVNLIGCFAIAALMHAALTLGWLATTRVAVTIGFIGGLTTYSSFNYETMRLVEEGAPTTAALNIALTVVGGFMAGWLGLVTAREISGAEGAVSDARTRRRLIPRSHLPRRIGQVAPHASGAGALGASPR